MRVAVVGTAVLGLMALPGVAAADVIFDPADADELASVLAEATADQSVCYGWDVKVDDAVAGMSASVGSNFGAGRPLTTSDCGKTVQFTAYITYTSESSESEDSASYDVLSSPGGPTRSDMDGLDLDFGSLTGEDSDVVIGKAVAALPLLAADKGMAKPIEAAPETGAAPADAQLTDDPGSDWWRSNGGVLLWGVGLLLGGGIFAWWAFRSSRRTWTPQRKQAQPYVVPDTVPSEFYDPAPTGPVLAPKPETARKPVVDTPPTVRTPKQGTAAPARQSAPATPPTSAATGQKPVADTQRTAAPATESAPGSGAASSPATAKPAGAESSPAGSSPAESSPARSTSDTPAPPSGTDAAPSDQKDKE